MPKRTDIWVATIALAIVSKCVGAAALRAPCDDSLTRSIPARSAQARGGHAFAQQIRGLTDDERELRIREELLAGNIPEFLRRLVPVRFPPPGKGSTSSFVRLPIIWRSGPMRTSC